MTQQLDLPLRKPASPLPPLRVSGDRQRARMTALADMQDWRSDFEMARDWYRQTFRTAIVEHNYRRRRSEVVEEHRRCAVGMPA